MGKKMEQRYNNKTTTVKIFLKLKTGCNEVHVGPTSSNGIFFFSGLFR